ncbi:MAG: hypothetical protein KUG83_03625 [Gammaproteobacteria bacterium]|nr:hypothetical protein [Gammaproteobacteria bacterium]
MRRKIPFLIVFVACLTSCDGSPDKGSNACIYSNENNLHSCFQLTAGSKMDFLSACKKILILNRLKDKKMAMGAADACPAEPSSTCKYVLENTADLNMYNLSSEEAIERQRRVCEMMKGIYIAH